MRFLWGLIGIIIGILIVWKSYALIQIFGRVSWAEEHLTGGFGGTYTLYKLVGIFIIVVSALYMFGILESFLGPLGGVFGGLGGE